MMPSAAALHATTSLAGAAVGRETPSTLASFRKVLSEQLLTPLYQPIVDLRTAAIVGFEGLIRGPADTALHTPAALFNVARMCGELVTLEQVCRSIHIATFKRLALPGRLFLNLNPDAAIAPAPAGHSGGMRALADTANLSETDVVLELTESFSSANYGALRQAMQAWRQAGVQLALDDLGEGYSSLRMWLELRPEFVKIDKCFIRGIDTDTVKRQFVRSMLDMARQTQAKVVAEGIETEGELRTVIRLGVHYGQGYWLGRPQAEPARQMPEHIVNSVQQVSDNGQCCPQGAASTVRRILRQVPALQHSVPTNDVYALFQERPDLHVVAVLRNEEPIGLIHRMRMLDKLARPYHRELYGNKPCAQILDNTPLIVDHCTSLQALGHLISEENPYHLSDGFIIVDDGQFLGVGTGFDLIREITQMQLNAARYANPLTQLPGNVPINEHIELLLGAGEPFAVCYCDLDQFKPFNDTYSYRKGDEVIQLTAGLLREHANPDLDFVGHIGGDDFIVVFRSPDWRERCGRVLDQFPLATRHLYKPEHLQAGGYDGHNREGVRVFHHLVSLSIGAVQVGSANAVYAHTNHQLAELAAQAKAQAKKIQGNALFVDRRALPDSHSTAL
jgi:EAL domain-containing protein (putative c-di-GMP-specific phosphodiesterase class I)/GGDEF domain-containing protein